MYSRNFENVSTDNCTLMELDVGGNSIGDDGILLICEGLRRNSVMKELWMEKCGISVKGILKKVVIAS